MVELRTPEPELVAGSFLLGGNLPGGRELVQSVDAEAEVVGCLLRIKPAVALLPVFETLEHTRSDALGQCVQDFSGSSIARTAIRLSDRRVWSIDRDPGGQRDALEDCGPGPSDLRPSLHPREGFGSVRRRWTDGGPECRVHLCAGGDGLVDTGAFRAGCRPSGAVRRATWESYAADLGVAALSGRVPGRIGRQPSSM